ncbi:MAG: hypothetical protein IT453_22335 [Planctomycetes bacterium]|nr:hypothetical protein [Planctomycetota bacterium]
MSQNDAEKGERDHLDKVRDILFGEQVRTADKRFAKLEAQLAKDLNEVKGDMAKRLESLEQFAKKEIEALAKRTKEEQADASGSLRELAKEVAELTKAFEKRTAALASDHQKAIAELRQQLLDQTKSLRAEIDAKTTDLSTEIVEERQEVDNTKVDRAALSALFADLAMRLSDKKSAKA